MQLATIVTQLHKLKAELTNGAMGQQISEAFFVGTGTNCKPFREVSRVAAAVFAERDRVMRETSVITELLFVTGLAEKVEAGNGLELTGSDCIVGSISDHFLVASWHGS